MPQLQDEGRRKEVQQEHPKAEAMHTQQAVNRFDQQAVNRFEQQQQRQKNEQNKKLQVQYQEQGQIKEQGQIQAQGQIKAQGQNQEQEVMHHNEQLNIENEDQTQLIYHNTPQKQSPKDKQKTQSQQNELFQKSQLQKTYKLQNALKPKSHHCLNVIFDEQLKQTLEQNKLLRVIFNHFCKQNNLISIKNTLFQDKQKKSQEMSLNRWMVFCKQLEIYSKLCKIKHKVRQIRAVEGLLPLQTSQVRQLHRMRQAKEVEKVLITIFKHSNQNASKLTFQSFLIAITNIFHHFKHIYPQDAKGINSFVGEILCCCDEKTCYKKLSHLKFTSTTPQIDYNKLTSAQGQLRAKAQAVLSKTKQNYDSRVHTLSSKENKQTRSRKSTKLNLNPVLIQAKRSLNQMNSYSKRSHNYTISLAKLNSKPQQPKRSQHQTQLIDYFQTTKDAILDSYFMLQSAKKSTPVRL